MRKRTFIFITMLFVFSKAYSIEHVSSPLISCCSWGIAVKDDIAYVGTEWGIQIFDVSDKENPVLVNSKMTTDIWLRAIHIYGDYLFASDASGTKTNIYDISNPIYPEYIGEIPSYAKEFEIMNNYLFTISWHAGLFEPLTYELLIFENDNFENFTEVVRIDSVASFVTKGNYIYTVKHNGYGICSLLTYDISDIENPDLIHTLNITNKNTKKPNLMLSDSLIYCSVDLKLFTISISDPQKPEIIHELENIGEHDDNEIVKYEDYLYLKSGSIISIEKPDSPEIVNNDPEGWPCADLIMDIFVYDNYLFFSLFEYGFGIMDISDPINPAFCAWYKNYDFYHGVYKTGDLLYVTSMNGVYILDVSHPENCIVTGSYPYLSWSTDIIVDNNYAYVSCDYGIVKLDVSDPENPYPIADCNCVSDKLLKRDSLLFSITEGYLGVYNIKTPDSINLVSAYASNIKQAIDMCIKGNYLFVADANRWHGYTYDGGLRVIDISDPENLQLVATINPDNKQYYRSIEIKGDYVFMGSNEPKIYVFDISNPVEPVVHSYIDMEERVGAVDMEIQGDYLYTTAGYGRYIFDISDINAIEELDYYPGNGVQNWSLYIDSCYIYEASSGGINIFYNEHYGTEIFTEPLNNLPDKIELYQNYPNPFNASTNIHYHLPKSSFVELKIYDVLGREIKTLVNDFQESGEYKIRLDLKYMPSGIYFYCLKTDEFIEAKKLVLLR